MDYDAAIKSFGIPQAVVLCVLLAVGKWVAGKALAWLGERLDKLAAFLGPHLHDWLTLRRDKLRLEVTELRRKLQMPASELSPTANNSAALIAAANHDEAPRDY